MKTIFIDECKQGPYILSGHLVDDKEITPLRRFFKDQLSPGQSQFHFSKEKDGKRQQMFKFFESNNCSAILVICKRESGKGLRETALRSMISAAERLGAERFVFDLDSSVKGLDDSILKKHNEAKGRAKKTKWDHVEYRDEPLLWVADGVGWGYNRKGSFRRLAKLLVIEEIHC
ncbi:MAG: hypothetical protein RL142_312 [Actinomycetota bacterium]|jgi:hypothetical protein